MDNKKAAQALLNFINTSPSAFHVVATAKSALRSAGFKELLPGQDWVLLPGEQYYLTPYDSMLIAFSIGPDGPGKLRIAAAHTDFPCLRIKPACSLQEKSYGKLNVEPYGGLIYNTWLDRPLSIAGKVALRGDDPFHPDIYWLDMKRPVLTIPNLAIHMNREINKGVTINPQKDLLPLAQTIEADTPKDFFMTQLASELDCLKESILAYELTIYPFEQGSLLGFNNDFISSPRLDNLTSVQACLVGLMESHRAQGLNVVALFDNEEVGSRTKQGAGSFVLAQTLERIYTALGGGRNEFLRQQSHAFMLSVDVAHGLHPNAPEKNDLTNIPILNNGVVLKTAANQSYAGDCEAMAIMGELCTTHHIPYQIFANRSDVAGGSTLGSIASTLLPIRTMDIGIPLLAMHSSRETMGSRDQQSLESLITVFFS